MPSSPMNPPSRYIVREIALPASAVHGNPKDVGQSLKVEKESLSRAVAQYLRIAEKSMSELRILRKSLDARARNRPLWRYAVEFTSALPLRHPRLSLTSVNAAVAPSTKTGEPS